MELKKYTEKLAKEIKEKLISEVTEIYKKDNENFQEFDGAVKREIVMEYLFQTQDATKICKSLNNKFTRLTDNQELDDWEYNLYYDDNNTLIKGCENGVNSCKFDHAWNMLDDELLKIIA